MTGKKLVVAALLLTNLASMAAAAEKNEHKSKNAQKLIATLNALGINDKELQQFINDVNSHVDNGYLNLAEEKAIGGKLTLRYKLSPKISIRQVELYYSHDNSPVECIAQTNQIKINYHIEF